MQNRGIAMGSSAVVKALHSPQQGQGEGRLN
jgi:hypothetical protein